jgi:hypothetical protein
MDEQEKLLSRTTDPDGIVDALMTDPKRARAVRKLLKDRLGAPSERHRYVPSSADIDGDADELWDNVPI